MAYVLKLLILKCMFLVFFCDLCICGDNIFLNRAHLPEFANLGQHYSNFSMPVLHTVMGISGVEIIVVLWT